MKHQTVRGLEVNEKCRLPNRAREKLMPMQNQARKHSGQVPVRNGIMMQNSQQLEIVSPVMLLNCGKTHQIDNSSKDPLISNEGNQRTL